MDLATIYAECVLIQFIFSFHMYYQKTVPTIFGGLIAPTRVRRMAVCASTLYFGAKCGGVGRV